MPPGFQNVLGAGTPRALRSRLPSLIALYGGTVGVNPLCPVCVHSERKEIVGSILGGVSVARIANQYGVTEASVRKHKNRCITQIVAATTTYKTVAAGIDTLAVAEDIEQESTRLGKLAENVKGDFRTALVAQRERAGGVELVARLKASMRCTKPRGLVQRVRRRIGLARRPLTDVRWLRGLDALVVALRPFPDAMRAVNAALVSLVRPAAVVEAVEALPEASED